MPKIEEFNVVIKTYNRDDLIKLLADGKPRAGFKVRWIDHVGTSRTITFGNSIEIIVETWESKKKDA